MCQCARPKVCPPENATTSVTSKFFSENVLIVFVVLPKGDGSLRVSVMLKVRPSFLPNGIGKSGPPDCTNFQTN